MFVAHHGVRFARARLPIRKQCAVVPVQDPVNDGTGDLVVDFFLGGVFVKKGVELKSFGVVGVVGVFTVVVEARDDIDFALRLRLVHGGGGGGCGGIGVPRSIRGQRGTNSDVDFDTFGAGRGFYTFGRAPFHGGVGGWGWLLRKTV